MGISFGAGSIVTSLNANKGSILTLYFLRLFLQLDGTLRFTDITFGRILPKDSKGSQYQYTLFRDA
jgi:hypothetical protein